MPTNDRSARTQDPQFKVRDPRLLAQPHSVPSFWRLFGLQQRQTRPIVYDSAFDTDDDALSTLYTGRSLLLGGTDRNRRYDIFDEMDNFGLVSAVLDVYAEESTQPDYDKGVRVWIESKQAAIVNAGEDCLRNCQVEDRIVPVVRRMCKYGDAFQRLLYSSGKGVLGWRYARQHDVERVEDKYGRLIGFREQGQVFRKGLHAGGTDVSFPWDYLHFRLLGKHEEEGYGTGLAERFFREWRNLTLTEDALLMYRLRRAPDRNMVMVDVGTLEDHEAMRYLNQWRKKMRKYEFIDPATPDYKKQYNPLTPLEDIFIPIRADTQTRIETLSGSGNIDQVYDLDHFTNAFFGAATAPKAYFGFEGEINAKATLQQQDVRFARTAKRVQAATVYGLRQLLDVHYTLLRGGGEGSDAKYDIGAKGNEYLVKMSPIAYLDEFERLELIQMRYQIVTAMSGMADAMKLDARVWASYILLNFAKLPEDMVLRLIQQTPEKPATGGGPGFDAMTAEQKEQVLDNKGKQRFGLPQLTEREMKAIAGIVHHSPGLRRSIMNFAELAEAEEGGVIRRMMAQQTDPSLLPVMLPGGVALNDSFSDQPKLRLLMEDLDVLKDPKRLAERKAAVALNERGSVNGRGPALAGAALRNRTVLHG